MISFITGLPGAGKTSWLVEQVIMPLAKNDWMEDAIDDDGKPVKIKRKLYTNINGLQLEHEKIGPDELNTWHQWVKPGDLIVFDEVQKPWPKVPAGTKKPECISELETHRHYGVDFWLLTQNTNLVNDAPVTLAAMHKHVRKVANSRFATVYEWDGVSKSLLYKNSLTKKPWRRSKAVEKMYRSSALHTKQARAIPTVLFVVLFCLVAFPAGAYWFKGKFEERYFGGVKIPEPTAKASSPAGMQTLALPQAPGAALVSTSAAAPVKPKLIGCVATQSKCECYDTQGAWVDTEVQQCRTSAGRGGVLVPYELHSPYVASIKSLPAPHDPQEVAPVMAAFTDGQVKR